jgi:hypothetical protein
MAKQTVFKLKDDPDYFVKELIKDDIIIVSISYNDSFASGELSYIVVVGNQSDWYYKFLAGERYKEYPIFFKGLEKL